jgi:hypothetical protein
MGEHATEKRRKAASDNGQKGKQNGSKQKERYAARPLTAWKQIRRFS